MLFFSYLSSTCIEIASSDFDNMLQHAVCNLLPVNTFCGLVVSLETILRSTILGSKKLKEKKILCILYCQLHPVRIVLAHTI